MRSQWRGVCSQYLPPLVLIRILSYTYNLKQKFQQNTENTKCQQSPNMAPQFLIG